jgi:hypothetical protein
MLLMVFVVIIVIMSSPDTAAAADAPKTTFGVESRVALETRGAAAMAIAIDTNGIVLFI